MPAEAFAAEDRHPHQWPEATSRRLPRRQEALDTAITPAASENEQKGREAATVEAVPRERHEQQVRPVSERAKSTSSRSAPLTHMTHELRAD